MVKRAWLPMYCFLRGACNAARRLKYGVGSCGVEYGKFCYVFGSSWVWQFTLYYQDIFFFSFNLSFLAATLMAGSSLPSAGTG